MNTNSWKGNILQEKGNFVLLSATTVCICNLNSNSGEMCRLALCEKTRRGPGLNLRMEKGENN